MDCKEFRELLDLYVDGELSPEATMAGQAHLRICIACSKVEQQVVLLRSAVKRVVNEHEPPSELVDRVRMVARPDWLRWFGHLPKGVQEVWRRKIAVPLPAFAMLLIAMLALGGWLVSIRPAPVAPQTPAGAREAPPPPASRGLDLTQFDHGERAAIYKVRVRNP